MTAYDPFARGPFPVGVRTHDWTDAPRERTLPVEVWYPAADSASDEAGESVALVDLIPQSVLDVLGDVSLPSIETIAVRDAPLRPLADPLPVVYFSHGFGGFAQQSVDLTSHLAGRGYVVFSTLHALSLIHI